MYLRACFDDGPMAMPGRIPLRFCPKEAYCFPAYAEFGLPRYLSIPKVSNFIASIPRPFYRVAASVDHTGNHINPAIKGFLSCLKNSNLRTVHSTKVDPPLSGVYLPGTTLEERVHAIGKGTQ